ncbi:UbiE family methyltransferase [Irpex rosettiformis]|uniref:UbiE family methyltransferase n=1 Tax=Irpex rosettiformis TaxID=378272 RepID=A0ACB8TQX0_9APHY|nr:UbiE family methyltransferase [Irpex rosettiformis]
MATEQAVYTHGHTAAVLRSHTWRTAQNSAAYLLPYLTAKPTATVLDIGCGPGTITADFASLIPQGHITALDFSEDVIQKAQMYAKEKGVVANMSFERGDAHALPFPDDTFDITHAHQVLQHVTNPVQVLREMRRVTKPGGIVATRETDFAGMIWYPESPGMTRWAETYARVARANGGEPNSGRRLLAWARQAGFDPAKVTCTSSCWCYATPEEREWWGGLWAERLLKSDFYPTAIKNGIATEEEIQGLSEAWVKWAESEDAWFSVPHGEIIAIV